MRRLGNYDGMDELYRRGGFRHLEDVAYARIALDNYSEPIDEIAKHLDSSYKGPQLIAHCCARVYPPS